MGEAKKREKGLYGEGARESMTFTTILYFPTTGIYSSVVRCMEFIERAAPLIRPRKVLQGNLKVNDLSCVWLQSWLGRAIEEL